MLCTHAHVYACVWRSEVNLRGSSDLSLAWNSPSRLKWLVRNRSGICPFLPPQSLDYRYVLLCLDLF